MIPAMHAVVVAAVGVEPAAVGRGRRNYQDNGDCEERGEAYQPREHGTRPGSLATW